MSITTRVVVPLTQARPSLSELADQVKAGAEKIVTKKSGESCVALIDSDRRDHRHLLERECFHLLLIDDARKGLEDVITGRTQAADKALATIQKRRADAAIC